MASYSHLMLQVAATMGFAAMVSTAAPAMAAEGAVPPSETAAQTVPAMIKHHVSRVRLAASHYHRHVYPLRSDLGCSGVWCGRQFVLMIGVSY
jgi:hypothetical protein